MGRDIFHKNLWLIEKGETFKLNIFCGEVEYII